jgi:hypothetical protein
MGNYEPQIANRTALHADLRDQGRMALVSVNEYVPEAGGITSRYTRSSPLAGTLAVAANEQHVWELRSSVSRPGPIDGFVDAWSATMALGGPIMRTVRQIDPPLSVIPHSGSPGFTSIVVD